MRDYMLEEEDFDDLNPYDTLSDRVSIDDVSVTPNEDTLSRDPASNEQIAPTNSVFNTISQRMRGPGGQPMSMAADTRLISSYMDDEQNTNEMMRLRPEANFMGSFGQAMSQAAQGPNTPASSASLYKNMSDQNDDLLKASDRSLDRRQKIISAIESRMGREANAEALAKTRQLNRNDKLDYQKKRNQLWVNRMVGAAEKEIRDDSLVKPSEMNIQSLMKSKGILENTEVPLTSQVLSDAEQDIASAMALRGLGASEGKIARTEMQMLGRKIAEAKAKYGNKIVDLRKDEPELVNQVMLMNQALLDDYRTTITDRKNDIIDNKLSVWGDEPDLSHKLNALRGTINKQYGPPKAPMKPKEPMGETGGVIPSVLAAGRRIVGKQYSKSRNQTKIIYNDGFEEIKDGQH